MRIAALGMALGLASLAPSEAGAVEVDGKMGVGYAQSAGKGPAGLSLVRGVKIEGMGQAVLEGIIGVDVNAPDSVNDTWVVAIGAGAHAVVADGAESALTLGLRAFYLGTGLVDADYFGWGFSIPARIYWWPDTNISVHGEIAASFVRTLQAVQGRNASSFQLAPQFDVPMSGGFGVTYWW
ncbi:MAG: hypothetical protein HYV07_20205 [Deltaproteobacteria bacterium]|nr:hypothetical protein [Deltaproteobacteria bacterium]